MFRVKSISYSEERLLPETRQTTECHQKWTENVTVPCRFEASDRDLLMNESDGNGGAASAYRCWRGRTVSITPRGPAATRDIHNHRIDQSGIIAVTFAIYILNE